LNEVVNCCLADVKRCSHFSAVKFAVLKYLLVVTFVNTFSCYVHMALSLVWWCIDLFVTLRC